MDINNIVAALVSGKWVLAGAFFVLGVVALLKQGYVSTWLASKLPSAAVPYLAVVLGVLGTAASSVISGKPLLQAIISGFQSGVTAVFLHEVIVEGLRKGKELIPSRLPSPSSAPPASPPAPPAPPPAKEAS
jgi:hypothetical protein